MQAPCPRCALPTAGGATCGRCLGKTPPYAATLAAYAYAFPVDRLLQRLKYDAALALADWAGAAIASAAAGQLATKFAELPHALVPVPLAPARERERGFNQAREIARAVRTRLSLPLLDALARRRDTPPQAELAWKARRSNVRGAFAAASPVRGLHLALVDDVMTTGATLAEAARTLTRAGAARVDAWVVARTLPPHR